MTRLLKIMSLTILAMGCGTQPPSETLGDRPAIVEADRDAAVLARPGGEPLPPEFNRLDSGSFTAPGLRGWRY